MLEEEGVVRKQGLEFNRNKGLVEIREGVRGGGIGLGQE